MTSITQELDIGELNKKSSIEEGLTFGISFVNTIDPIKFFYTLGSFTLVGLDLDRVLINNPLTLNDVKGKEFGFKGLDKEPTAMAIHSEISRMVSNEASLSTFSTRAILNRTDGSKEAYEAWLGTLQIYITIKEVVVNDLVFNECTLVMFGGETPKALMEYTFYIGAYIAAIGPTEQKYEYAYVLAFLKTKNAIQSHYEQNKGILVDTIKIIPSFYETLEAEKGIGLTHSQLEQTAKKLWLRLEVNRIVNRIDDDLIGDQLFEEGFYHEDDPIRLSIDPKGALSVFFKEDSNKEFSRLSIFKPLKSLISFSLVAYEVKSICNNTVILEYVYISTAKGVCTISNRFTDDTIWPVKELPIES